MWCPRAPMWCSGTRAPPEMPVVQMYEDMKMNAAERPKVYGSALSLTVEEK